jgi:hypothetical protein
MRWSNGCNVAQQSYLFLAANRNEVDLGRKNSQSGCDEKNGPMGWHTEAIEQLQSIGPCGYHAGGPPAAEPTALAAIALLGGNRIEAARSKLRWLAKIQTFDGSVPPLAKLTQPSWPTAWAIIAAALAARQKPAELNAPKAPLEETPAFDIVRAQERLLSIEGGTLEPSPDFGHDPQLVGWPWVVKTHSWQEPTAMSVLALKALGLKNHPRTRQGVKLLVDRLLIVGGCNYGNTVVLGQRLRPHVEPTGLTLLALAGEAIDDPRIERSLTYLSGALSPETTPISLSYGLLGLAAQARLPNEAADWLEGAYRSTVGRDASPYAIALLVLAAQANDCPLMKLTQAQGLPAPLPQ